MGERAGLRTGLYEYMPPTPEPPVFSYTTPAAPPADGIAFVTPGGMSGYGARDVGVVSGALSDYFDIETAAGTVTAAGSDTALLAESIGHTTRLAIDPTIPTASPTDGQRIVLYAASTRAGIAGVAVYMEVGPHPTGERAEVRTLRMAVCSDRPTEQAAEAAEGLLTWLERRSVSLGDEVFEQSVPTASTTTASDVLPQPATAVERVVPAGNAPTADSRQKVLIDNPFGEVVSELTDALPTAGRTEPATLAEHLAAPAVLPATIPAPPTDADPATWAQEHDWTIDSITTFPLPFGRTLQPPVVSVEVTPAEK